MNILKSFSVTIPFLFLSFTIDLWFGVRRDIAPVLLGAVTGGIGTVTSFSQQYLPQIIWFTTATPPDINIKVAGADGTIWDILGAGVNEFATIRQMSRTTNYYLLELANSLVNEKTVTYTITNQTAAAFNVYGDSIVTLPVNRRKYNIAVSQVILASSGAKISNFTYLAMPGAGATDRYTINYNDPAQTSQSYDSRDELKAFLQFTQNSIGAASYSVDNVADNVKNIQLFPAAQQTVYVRKQSFIGNVQSTLLANG